MPGMKYCLPPPAKGYGPLIAAEFSETGSPDQAHYDELAVKKEYIPRIYFDESGKMQEFHVFDLKILSGLRSREFDTVSAMLEVWFDERESSNRKRQMSFDLVQLLKARAVKLSLKKQRLLEDLHNAENADKYKRQGELITANIYMLKKGQDRATVTDYSQDPPEEVTISLDPLLTPAQNAQKQFKRYSKSKTAIIEKKKQLKITDDELLFLETFEVYIANAQSAAEISALRDELGELGYIKRKTRRNASKGNMTGKPVYTTENGLTIMVGRTGRENDDLTFKKARPRDLWLHTKNIPGSHVILFAPEEISASRDPIEGFGGDSIRIAAEIAAYYSKAKDSENVPVDYTLVKHVKKPPGAKPGMVTFTNNRTIYVNPSNFAASPQNQPEGER